MKTFEQILRESEDIHPWDDVSWSKWHDENREPDWFKTKPKVYTIQGKLSDKTEKYTNKLEGNSYDMSSPQYADTDWVILKGTVGELWPVKLDKACKKYGVAPDKFYTNKGEWIEMTTQPVNDFTNWAKLNTEKVYEETEHGVMKGNAGSYTVCDINDTEHKDTWIIHEDVFPNTYYTEEEL